MTTHADTHTSRNTTTQPSASATTQPSAASSESRRAIWETYASAWRAVTAEEKAKALAASVRADCVYRDPTRRVDGHAALIAYMIDFHREVPGGHFETIYFQAHHDRSIAKWNMRNAAGALLADGVSHGEYDGDGKLIAMTGFFEVPPQ